MEDRDPSVVRRFRLTSALRIVDVEDEDPRLEHRSRRRSNDACERIVHASISQNLVSIALLGTCAGLIDRAKICNWLGRCPSAIDGCDITRGYRVGALRLAD
jgi:hypothetical protein